MQSLRKGYTLAEAVVVLGIVSLLSLGIGVGYGNFREKLDIEEAKVSVITSLETYRDRAYYTHRSYSLLIDTGSKCIEFWEDSTEAKKYRIELPKKLRYRIPGWGGQGNMLTQINPNGNLGNAFTLYIFGKSDRAKYRLGFYPFLQLKYLKINLYRNIGASEAVLGNIDKYHETSGAKNLVGWEMVR
ncbi:MAG: type II secretion system protein [Fusobacteriaceae bacterium]